MNYRLPFIFHCLLIYCKNEWNCRWMTGWVNQIFTWFIKDSLQILSFLSSSFSFMSLETTSSQPCRDYSFACLFWSCSAFYYYFFFPLMLADSFERSDQSAALGTVHHWREVEGMEGNIFLPSPLSSPSRGPLYVQAAGVNAEVVCVCIHVWGCMCVHTCGKGRANQSSTR